MKRLFIILSSVLLFAACSNDDKPESNQPAEVTPVIKEGMEMYSQVFVDGEILEEAIDKVVNFGNAEIPLLYHVNQSHTYRGVAVPEGKADMDCSYYSLTEREYLGFIKLYAISRGIAAAIGELTDEQKLTAFIDLTNLLYETKIELALLIYLANNDVAELRALDQLLQNLPVTRSSQNDPNLILTSMIRADIKPTILLRELENEGINFSNLVERADLAGLNIPQLMTRSSNVLEVIEAVINGVVILSKIIIAFIEHAEPVVDMESTYISYLHESDLNPLNYYGTEVVNSKTYECRYGTKGDPMAQCIFHVESYIKAKHKTLAGYFIPRVGMVVERVRATAFMSVEGTVSYTPGQGKDSSGGPAAYCESEVTIKHGDCCCNARTARLKYTLHALDGFNIVEWKNGK